MEIVDFLRARLDEDEVAAKKAKPGPWRADGDRGGVYGAHPPDEVVDYTESAAHIARHDPARVLAEVDAKRQMVDDYARNAAAAEAEQCPNEWNGGIDKLGYFVLPLLALPYADHPDYRSEWRP